MSEEGKEKMSRERKRTEDERLSAGFSLKTSAPGNNLKGGSNMKRLSEERKVTSD